jgi:putative transposase
VPIRKIPLVKNEVYHICNKSIAGFKIFNNDRDYKRMVELMSFYIFEKVPCKFSMYKKLRNVELEPSRRYVNIVAYCLMPTHIHFILKQNQDNGIESFIGLISHSYSNYFNLQHARKGPLWEGRFKNVLIKNDEQLLHLTRYIHLNPVTAFLVNAPGNWKYSSYKEYIEPGASDKRLCNFCDLPGLDTASYKNFVLDQINYQRQLAIIKEISLED